MACGSVPQDRTSVDEITLRGDAIAREIEASLIGTKGEINCDRVTSQGIRVPGSFVQLGPSLGDRRFEFSVPDRTTDISYAGSIIYKVNHIRLDRVGVTSVNGQFVFQANFKAADVALKGYHSALGDAAVPDLKLENMRLIVRLTPVVAGGKVTYDRPQVSFAADVDNTFLPRFQMLGRTVDVMDTLTNYRRDLCKSIQVAIQTALDDPARKAALATKIEEGITGEITGPSSPILGLRFEGTDLIVKLRRQSS
jgi:hypothetical protein